MKRFTITIPTNVVELKEFMMNKFGWMTHQGRMKINNALLNELCKEICKEINSGYWNKDISDYMKKELTCDTGKIRQMIYNAKRRLV